MAQRAWRFLKLFKKYVSREEKDASSEVQRRRHYLELSRKCMEVVQTMTSQSVYTSMQFNHGQCEYLANKLKEAVHDAEMVRFSLPSVEIMKFLWRTSKEVESVIHGCCRKNWIRAAVMLANMSEHVIQLSADLEFCILLMHDNQVSKAFYPMVEYELNCFTRRQSVKARVEWDLSTLLTKLDTLNGSSNLSEQESQLTQSLSSRLAHHLSGSVQVSVWEIQYSNLVPGQKLGSGAAGTVRRSKWLGEEVAEKMFHGSNRSSFKNEVEILAGLAHPNIVPLLGCAVDGNNCFIIMELMDESLFSFMVERLRQNPTLKVPFSDFETLDMMLQTAKGMLYLHEHNVVHRDLKSLNILVKSRKDIDVEFVYAKVADFGLSKTKESSSSYTSLTLNTGTTRWMAPELMPPGEDLLARTSDHDSQLKYPFKVDVYSFGMVCYEICTGQVPFSSNSPGEVKKMVLKGDRPKLPDHFPHALKHLIHSCWDAEASRRPPFAEICKQLRRLKYLMMKGSGSVKSEDGTFSVIRALELQINFGLRNGFEREYKVENLFGVGQYNKVFVAIEISTGNKFAVKRIEKVQVIYSDSVEEVKREVHMWWMRIANIVQWRREHENFVQFHEAFEDDNHVYIVMELCEGGNLQDRIKAMNDNWYSENNTVRIVRQMLNVLVRCHGSGVLHRNIKPENFLFKSSSENSPLKGTGFGRSRDFIPGERFCDVVGTLHYMAPEVLKMNSGPESDMWSIGVITYTLLCGRCPFSAETDVGIRTQILENNPDFQREPWPSITVNAKDFVRRLLMKDPFSRPTATGALSHPWVNEEWVSEGDSSGAPITKLSLEDAKLISTFENLGVGASRIDEPNFTLKGKHKGEHPTTFEVLNKGDEIQAHDAFTSITPAIVQKMMGKSILFDRADLLRMVGKDSRALEDLNMANKIELCDAFTLQSRGVVLKMMGKCSEALEDLNMANEIEPCNAFTLKYRGDVFTMMGKYSEALEDLNMANKIKPCDAFTLTARGVVLKMMGKCSEALEDLNMANEIEPRNAFTLKYRGDVFTMMGKYSEALEDLNMANEIKPCDNVTLTTRGVVLKMMGKCSEALEDLNMANEIKPRNAFTLKYRGDVFTMMGKYSEALEDLNMANEIKPCDNVTLTTRGVVLKMMGKCSEALEDLNMANEIEPRNAFTLKCRGDVFTMMDKYSEALEDLNMANEIKPCDNVTLTTRGVVLKMMGKCSEALEDLNMANEIEPRNAFTLKCRGDVFTMMDKYSEALEDLNMANEIKPCDAFTLTARGVVLKMMGKCSEALEDLNMANEIEPRNAFTLKCRGDVFTMMGKYSEALEDLNMANEIKPCDNVTLTTRGVVLKMMGKCSEALEDLNMANEIEPRNAFTLKYRGDVFTMMDKYSEALEDLNMANEIKPCDAFTLTARGVVLKMMGKCSEALEDLNMANEIEPRNAFTLKCRGDVFTMMDKYSEALEDLNMANEIKPCDNVTLTTRGVVLKMMGKCSEALEDLNMANEIEPRNAFTLKYRGDVFTMMDKYSEALEDLNMANEIKPCDAFTLTARGVVLKMMGKCSEALEDLNMANEIKPHDVSR